MGVNQEVRPDSHKFAARLQQALDRVAACPPMHDGRGVWVATKFGVSQPTTNGWLNGHYLPTPARVKELAKLTKVRYEWLYFGTPPMLAKAPERKIVGQPSQPLDADLLAEAYLIATAQVRNAGEREYRLERDPHRVVAAYEFLAAGRGKRTAAEVAAFMGAGSLPGSGASTANGNGE